MAQARAVAAAEPDKSTWRTYVCKHVTEGGGAVLSVFCDERGVEALCGSMAEDAHPPGSVQVEAWGCVTKRDPTLDRVTLELEPGIWCHRTSIDAPWEVELDDA